MTALDVQTVVDDSKGSCGGDCNTLITFNALIFNTLFFIIQLINSFVWYLLSFTIYFYNYNHIEEEEIDKISSFST